MGKKGALKANSLLTGAGGAAYLAGPVLAGFLSDKYGPKPAILLASVCCLVSALLTICSIAAGGMKRHAVGRLHPHETALSCLKDGIAYCRAVPAIRELLAAGFVLGLCTISVNLAFYPFAFDMLKVDAKGWSMMITTYYGANLFAVFVAGQLEGRPDKHCRRAYYGCLTVLSLIWLLYSAVKRYAAVLMLQFAEGTALAVGGIILAARLQTAADREYMARAAALVDVMAGAGKLIGMGITSYIIGRHSCTGVFVFCSILLLIFAVNGGFRSGRFTDLKYGCSPGD
jgi:MFS family permease